MDPRTILMGMLKKYLDKINKKARSTIQLCLVDLVFSNVLGEHTAKKPCDNSRNLYQLKYLVEKLFL
jgi:hypothetical protein